MFLLVGIGSLPVILIYLLVAVIFLAVLYLLLSKLPEPIAGWAKLIVIVVAAILLIYFLLSLVGGSSVRI